MTEGDDLIGAHRQAARQVERAFDDAIKRSSQPSTRGERIFFGCIGVFVGIIATILYPQVIKLFLHNSLFTVIGDHTA